MYIGSRVKAGGRSKVGGDLSPISLFLTGAQGVWFDRQDLSSMYQDAAGTTACAVGSPVGLALDKSKGAVRGANAVTNGTFDANLAGWTAGTGGWAWNNGVAQLTGDGTAQSLLQSTLTSGQWYEVTWDAVITSGAGIALFTNGGATNVLNAATTGSYRTIFQAIGTSLEFKRSSGIVAGSIDNVVARPIPGNHATQGTAASRPILRQDASGRYYLEYDGVDDGMATAAVDFTGTAQMTVLAGVYKASDAAAGLFAELGTSTSLAGNPGSFSIGASASNGTDRQSWFSEARGSGGGVDGTQPQRQGRTYAAPASAVLCGAYDLAQAAVVDEVGLRVNGAVPPTYTSAGTAAPGGKFANAPIYIGRRGGTTLPFNGRDYGLIVVGRALTATEIARAERFLASRMGIAL